MDENESNKSYECEINRNDCSNEMNEKTPSEIKFIFNLKSGINQEESKEITKLIKDYNKKIQTSFQNQMIRVTSKKRDELQNVITRLKESNIKTPLSYINFRD